MYSYVIVIDTESKPDKPQKSRKCLIYTTNAIKGEGISVICL